MTSSILFAGQEDISFTPINTSIQASVSVAGTFGIETTANSFRSGYARYSLAFLTNNSTLDTTHYIRAPFSATTSFWSTFRLNSYTPNTVGNGSTMIPIRFVDSGGVVRLRIKFTGVNGSPNDTFIVETLNTAGTNVQIGSTSTGRFASAVAGGGYQGTCDKIDIFVNYAVSGQFTVYLNGVQTFTFVGDVTTNSVTTLAGMELGQAVECNQNGSFPRTSYSEVIVATRDTRNMSLVTQVATANGNTHGWDGGTAGNCAAQSFTTSDVAPQFSATAAQIQEYQVTPALPTGTFGVISVVQHARATIGATGPTKIDFAVRTGGSDFFSPDQAVSTAWGLLTYNWDTNPNTTTNWLQTDLAASSTSFNFGFKSIT